MAFNWLLGNLSTGSITRSNPLPVSGGSTVSIDIHSDDDANVSIPMLELTAGERANWKTTFSPIERIMVLENDSVAWNASNAILFAGFVNKMNKKIKPNVIDLQLAGLGEYVKTRIVGENWGTVITDPMTVVTFTADTWQGVMNAVISRCFNFTVPTGQSKPPAVLGSVGSSTGTIRKKDVFVTDKMNYSSVLDEIASGDSGSGLEWRLVPRWASSAKNRVVWDFVTGTEGAPHIKESSNVDLVLADNANNFSALDLVIDSNEKFSAIYGQSKVGNEETKDGADLQGMALTESIYPILLEQSFEPGVELTSAQMQAQLETRLSFGIDAKYTANFTVEAQGSPSTWLNRLGSTLNLIGVDGTTSAGYDAELRCVGVDFTPGKGTVSIEVMQKQPIYPRLPRKTLGKVKKDTTTGTTLGRPPKPGGGGGGSGGDGGGDGGDTGGGTTPKIPKDDSSGLDGREFSNDEKWGSEGFGPGDIKQKVTTPLVSDYREQVYTYENIDGLWPIDPQSMFQDTGNRLYGLDRSSYGVSTRITPYLDPQHWNGGMDYQTGEISVLPSLFIKKTYMGSNGDFGAIETIGEVSGTELRALMAEYENSENYEDVDDAYNSGGRFGSGFYFSNWVVNGRYYLCISHAVSHYSEGRLSKPWNLPDKWFWNAKTTTLSKAINKSDGKFAVGGWRTEAPTIHGYHPLTGGIKRWGNTVAFGLQIALLNEKVTTMTQAEWLERRIQNLEAYGLEFPNLGWDKNFGVYPPTPVTNLREAEDNNWPYSRPIGYGLGVDGASLGFCYTINYSTEIPASPQVFIAALNDPGFTQGSRLSAFGSNIVSNGIIIDDSYSKSVLPTKIENTTWWNVTPNTWTGEPLTQVNGWILMRSFYDGNPEYKYIDAGLKKASTYATGETEGVDFFTETELIKKFWIPYACEITPASGYASNGITNNSSRRIHHSICFSFRGRTMQIWINNPNQLLVRSVRIDNE